jgi:hypothetical protein
MYREKVMLLRPTGIEHRQVLIPAFISMVRCASMSQAKPPRLRRHSQEGDAHG